MCFCTIKKYVLWYRGLLSVYEWLYFHQMNLCISRWASHIFGLSVSVETTFKVGMEDQRSYRKFVGFSPEKNVMNVEAKWTILGCIYRTLSKVYSSTGCFL